MDNDLDTVLASDLLDIPDDFTQRVMDGVRCISQRDFKKMSWLERLQNHLFITGGIVSLSRFAVFMCGILTVSAVG